MDENPARAVDRRQQQKQFGEGVVVVPLTDVAVAPPSAVPAEAAR